jgi:hypothetical protein
MTYYGGKIIMTAVTKSLFWGTSWGSYSGDKITGIDSCYQGFVYSSYAKTSDEYTGPNGQIGATTTHQGHIVDTSTASGGSNTSVILAESPVLIRADRLCGCSTERDYCADHS